MLNRNNLHNPVDDDLTLIDQSNLINQQHLKKLLSSLNDQQLQAVKTTEGPLLVLAGAGTGKTKVLTSRIIHIISSQLCYPSQILAVTFTNKAASEMKKRMAELIGDQVNNIWVGTFHSICAKILRRHPEVVGLKSDFTIIDDDDQNRLIKQILNDLNIDTKQFPTKFYLNKISRLKDSLKKSSDVANDDLSLPKLRVVFETYQYRLKSMNAVDFGDLINLNLEIFANDLSILEYYQNKFRYILIDEYQDTNTAQYQWLIRLSSLHCNICCVGDDDQSIYSWRGANIANILRFEKDFADAKVIRLEQNYRSTSRILKTADSVISNNKQRHGKTLWTDLGQGEKIKVLSYNDDRLEALMTAKAVEEALTKRKIKANEIAILVRAGHQTRAFEEAFMQNSIPYRVIGGMKFYERMEVKDAIAYLRVCANLSDDLAMSRIINIPKRGVGDTALANFFEQSKTQNQPLFFVIKNALEQNQIKGKAKDSLVSLMNIFEKFNQQITQENLTIIAKNLLSEVGYLAMWKNDLSPESQGRIENIEEFINSLNDFSSITDFLEYVSLVEARDEKNLVDAISIMTVHGAKGLEFEMVFLPGLEEGIFPSAKAVDERNGLEEERRLMYVAITRAKKNLTISFAKSRYIFGEMQFCQPSRFIRELDENELEFEEVNFSNNNSSLNYHNSNNFFRNSNQSKETSNYKNYSFNFGSKSQTDNSNSYNFAKQNQFEQVDQQDQKIGKRIFHQKFGYGKVIKVDGKKLQIQFEKAGEKIVMEDFVKF
jgi:DNA helicase-2/ATP-dependent DNA helicase PcrA